jgi:hypothetical protein
MGVKMMGKKSVPIEGLGKMNCDFASMDAPRSSQESSRSEVLPKSGNMSSDMDAALKKLENRRVAAALNQHVPPQPQTSNRERGQAQFVRSRRNSAASNKIRPKRLKKEPMLRCAPRRFDTSTSHPCPQEDDRDNSSREAKRPSQNKTQVRHLRCEMWLCADASVAAGCIQPSCTEIPSGTDGRSP